VFFELAKGLKGADAVAGVGATHLVAISLGAVLCGAMTYIGNGPNFMVKSIAEAGGVRMPSFGGYVLRWALPCLAPILAAMVLVFLVQDWRARVAGGILTVVLVGAHARRAMKYPDPHTRGDGPAIGR
jgi:hypothetical protein